MLEARRRVLGEEHPDTLTSMNNLADTLRAQGDLPGARALQEKVLEALRRVLGEEHPDTLTSMSNLASTLRAQGDLPGARALQEKVLEAVRRVLGEEHPNTLTSMSNLAGTLRAQGDLPGARALQEKGLETRRRVLGEEHPDTLTSMNNLADGLRQTGEAPPPRAAIDADRRRRGTACAGADIHIPLIHGDRRADAGGAGQSGVSEGCAKETNPRPERQRQVRPRKTTQKGTHYDPHLPDTSQRTASHRHPASHADVAVAHRRLLPGSGRRLGSRRRGQKLARSEDPGRLPPNRDVIGSFEGRFQDTDGDRSAVI